MRLKQADSITKTEPTAPWDVSEAEFPTDGTDFEKWVYFLRWAVLAPSSHNSQPWQFHIHGSQVDLYADRSRACPIVDPDDRELIMSCGCALFHLKTALWHFGCLGELEILPDPGDDDLLACLSLGTQYRPVEEPGLLSAIPRRRTNRQPFRDASVPESILTGLISEAGKESARLQCISDPLIKRSIGELVSEGDLRQWADEEFRHELAKWVHPSHHTTRDGIPGYAQGTDDLLSYDGPLVVRTFDLGDGQAAKDHQLAAGSPALAVLGTHGDTPRDWMAAGQALAGVLLRARAGEIWASFLNQPTELPDLRLQLAALLGSAVHPQAVLRLGFADEVKPTPRREVEDVLL